MRKLTGFISAFSVLLMNYVFGQNLPINQDTSIVNQELTITGNFENSATAIKNDVMNAFLFGGSITPDMKDVSFADHGPINRVGAEISSGIEYKNYNMHLLKKKTWGTVIKAGYQGIGGVLYPKDLFGVVLYGNERYLGDTIDLSGTNMRFVSWQKLGVGLIDPVSKSGISLNIYNISRWASTTLYRAQFYEDMAGDSVAFNITGITESSDNLKFNQGIGVGVDVDIRTSVNWGKDRIACIQFMASNIGFAYLYEKQRVYKMDTSFHFSGFELDDFLKQRFSGLDSMNVLDSLGITSTLKNKTIFLPGFIQVGKIVTKDLMNPFQSFFGIRLYPSMLYNPFVYAGIHWNCNPLLGLGANVSYGGYTHFKGGLYTQLNLKKFNIGIGTENILGWIMSESNGRSLTTRLRWEI